MQGRQLGWSWAAVVFAVALAIRLWHVADIRPSPFFDVLVGDARAYDAWAQRIAGGDWIGRDVFYQAPLYPYFLGTLYAMFGRDLLIVRLVQVTIGAVACGCLAVAGARLFGRKAGIAAGLLLAVYAPAVFFDALIQKAVLDGILICLALSVVGLLVANPQSSWGWGGLGLTLGMLALTRENAMVLIAVVALWSIMRRTDREADGTVGERVRRRTVPFLVALAVVLTPIALRNFAVGGGFYVTTSQFGTNLYLGNNPLTDGTAGSLVAGRGAAEYEQRDAIELAERATGRSLSPGEVSAYWTSRAVAFVSSQPWAWLKLMARKTLLLVNTTEMLDTESQESYAEWSIPLRLGGYLGHFGVLVPLAAIGLMLTWPARRQLWVLYALAGAYALSVVLFFIYARYRYPLVPFLILFAGVSIVGIYERLSANSRAGRAFQTRQANSRVGRAFQARQANSRVGRAFQARQANSRVGRAFQARQADSRVGRAFQARQQMWSFLAGGGRWRSVLQVAAIVLLIVVTNRPMLSASRMRAITEHNYGAALQGDKRIDEALAHYERAVAADPTYVPAYSNMGAALSAQGRIDAAKRAYQRALELDPEFADAHFNLGNTLLREGNAAAAIEHFERARRARPGAPELNHNLGLALAEAGRLDDAAAAYERALALSPASVETLTALADVESSRGRTAKALDYLRRSVALRPADAATHYNVARLLLESDRAAEALPEFEEAVRLAPGKAEMRNDFGIALATLGRFTEARQQFREALRLSPGDAAAARNLAALPGSAAPQP